MFKKILLAVDYSDQSKKAVVVAADIAAKYGAQVLVEHVKSDMTVAAGYGGYAPSTFNETSTEADTLVSDAVAQLAAAGVTASSEVQRGIPISDVLVATAASHHVDLIVMGSHGRSDLGGLVLGSVAHGVLHETTCPVLIAR